MVAPAHFDQQASWPLASTSVGGRLCIAHNPNQGSSAVGVRKHSKKQSTHPWQHGGGDLTIQPLGADDLFLTALSTGKQAKRAFTPCLHTTLGVAPDPKVLKDLGVGANSGWLT